jgi:hypothetical protein
MRGRGGSVRCGQSALGTRSPSRGPWWNRPFPIRPATARNPRIAARCSERAWSKWPGIPIGVPPEGSDGRGGDLPSATMYT